MFEIKKAESRGGWKTIVDGEELTAGHLKLVHEKFGRVEWGLRPEGYAGWAFFEPGGGGSVTLPFSKTPNGEIFVALIKENRLNMGGENWCIIGGYLTPGESHQQTAEQEAEEEAGLTILSPPSLLGGVPSNSNRAIFVADPQKDEGVHSYKMEIPWAFLEEAVEEGCFKMAPGRLNHKKESEMRFFHWKDAIRKTPDVLARGAIAQLLAELL